jgi:hypothetical protein
MFSKEKPISLLDPTTARSTVRRMLNADATLEIRVHAARRMSERGISLPEVRRVLRRGFVNGDKTSFVRGEFRYQLESGDTAVVVEIWEDENLIPVITVIDLD